jgi:hypothetical protein
MGMIDCLWTIETAREHAKEQWRDASLGVDRQKRKAAARAEPTVTELIDRYLKEGPVDKQNKRSATIGNLSFQRQQQHLYRLLAHQHTTGARSVNI